MGKEGTDLRNLKTNKKLIDLFGITYLAPKFSNDGKYLVGSNFESLKFNIMNTKTFKKVLDLKSDFFRNCSFSPDSQNIACGFEPKTENIFTYSIKDKIKTAILVSDEKEILKSYEEEEFDSTDRNNIQYSPDGKFILAKSKKFITIWKIK